MTIEVGFSA
jgi:dynein heavy chain